MVPRGLGISFCWRKSKKNAVLLMYLYDQESSMMRHLCLQVTQLEELLAVRHSVFVVGGPGTGKSQVNFCITTIFSGCNYTVKFGDFF